MTLKVKVNAFHFQYQQRESKDAYFFEKGTVCNARTGGRPWVWPPGPALICYFYCIVCAYGFAIHIGTNEIWSGAGVSLKLLSWTWRKVTDAQHVDRSILRMPGVRAGVSAALLNDQISKRAFSVSKIMRDLMTIHLIGYWAAHIPTLPLLHRPDHAGGPCRALGVATLRSVVTGRSEGHRTDNAVGEYIGIIVLIINHSELVIGTHDFSQQRQPFLVQTVIITSSAIVSTDQ